MDQRINRMAKQLIRLSICTNTLKGPLVQLNIGTPPS